MIFVHTIFIVSFRSDFFFIVFHFTNRNEKECFLANDYHSLKNKNIIVIDIVK